MIFKVGDKIICDSQGTPLYVAEVLALKVPYDKHDPQWMDRILVKPIKWLNDSDYYYQDTLTPIRSILRILTPLEEAML